MGLWSYLCHCVVGPSAAAKAAVCGFDPAAPPIEPAGSGESAETPADHSGSKQRGGARCGGGGGNDRRMDQDAAFAHVCEGLRTGRYRRIVVMTGAGVSTAAGIPDFRSRTGMYELSRTFPELPSSWAVFDGKYFPRNPRPLYFLIRKMMLAAPDAAGASAAAPPAAVAAAGIAAHAEPVEGGGQRPGGGPTGTPAGAADVETALYRPTLSHHFFALLARKGLLLRLYTQNVDCLDVAAGVPHGQLVQVHGTIADAKCTACGARAPLADVLDDLRSELPPAEARAELRRVAGKAVADADDRSSTSGGGRSGEVPEMRSFALPACRARAGCGGPVKPGVVLFGDSIPPSFVARSVADMPRCDLLLCLGSTFQVMPFANLIGAVDSVTPRLLFNREPVAVAGVFDPLRVDCGRGFFRFDKADNYRDVFVRGDCDDGIRRMCAAAGWTEELEALVAEREALGPGRAAVCRDSLIRMQRLTAEGAPTKEPW